MDGTVVALPNERALVARATAEPAAFAVIYDHYFPRVYNYVRYRVRDAETADDVTAQVFERALVSISSYRPERGPFAPWLFAIARNAVKRVGQTLVGYALVTFRVRKNVTDL